MIFDFFITRIIKFCIFILALRLSFLYDRCVLGFNDVICSCRLISGLTFIQTIVGLASFELFLNLSVTVIFKLPLILNQCSLSCLNTICNLLVPSVHLGPIY